MHDLTYFKYKKPYRKISQGFTLIELLIALIISTLLAMATWISFNATNNANNNQTAVSEIRDNAFYILDRVEYMIKHAGFNHYSEGLAALNTPHTDVIAFPDQYNNTNFNQKNDDFAIQMNIPNFNNQEMIGCTGANIPAGSANDVFTLHLYTQGNSTQTQLLCEVRKNNIRIQGPVITAQNIGRFKVFYRQVSQSGTLKVCGGDWQSAQAIGNDFTNVCAVHLSLVALSDQRVLHSVVQNIEIAPDAASQNSDTLVTVGANKALARTARFIPKTIQTRNQ